MNLQHPKIRRLQGSRGDPRWQDETLARIDRREHRSLSWENSGQALSPVRRVQEASRLMRRHAGGCRLLWSDQVGSGASPPAIVRLLCPIAKPLAWRTEQTGGHVGRTSFFTGGESMQSHPAKIVRADETDAGAIITILSTGFQNDPVSRWLFPDDDARERLHPEFFGLFVKMALEDGEIYTTEDRTGTALWFPVTAHHEDQPGLGELYQPILGADYAKRIADFDERSTANHPDHEDHFYLPFIAVRPQLSGQGIGTALLRDRLAALDSQGLPTYLEASNRDSARLYERLGYKRLDRTTDMPGGPSLYPMWRNPA